MALGIALMFNIRLPINNLWRELVSQHYLQWVPGWIGTLAGDALTFIAVVAAATAPSSTSGSDM